MQSHIIFSRRNVGPDEKTDFRPDDPVGKSPFAQLRRLLSYLKTDLSGADDITDCDEGLQYLREYQYRKIFGGTSHDDFVKLDSDDPQAIDWLLAVHHVESSNFQAKRTK